MPAEPLTLHYSSFGQPSSPPMVILHGLFGSNSNWRTIAKALAGRFYVVVPDLRNHGDSPWHDSMSYQEMASDVAGLIQHCGLVNPTLIGHSMGGKVAMILGQNQLTPIRQLVVADIAPIFYHHHQSHQRLITAMQAIDVAGSNSRAQIDQQLQEHIPDTPTRQFLLQNLDRAGGGYRWRIHLTAIHANMGEIMGYPCDVVSEMKTLFIAGEQSEYVSTSSHEAIKTLFPNSRITTMRNAGHWLHAEQPQAFINQVSEFARNDID